MLRAELASGRVKAGAGEAPAGAWHPAGRLGVLVLTLACMLAPPSIGMLVLLGVIR